MMVSLPWILHFAHPILILALFRPSTELLDCLLPVECQLREEIRFSQSCAIQCYFAICLIQSQFFITLNSKSSLIIVLVNISLLSMQANSYTHSFHSSFPYLVPILVHSPALFYILCIIYFPFVAPFFPAHFLFAFFLLIT